MPLTIPFRYASLIGCPQALRLGGIIGADGYVLDDPRKSEWQSALAAVEDADHLHGDGLRADESAIGEELNVAWGFHEISADKMPEILAFFVTAPAAEAAKKRDAEEAAAAAAAAPAPATQPAGNDGEEEEEAGAETSAGGYSRRREL